jgi:predicted ferric reductase
MFSYLSGLDLTDRWLLCMFAGILCIIGAIQNHILPMVFTPHSYDIEGGDSRKAPAPSKISAYFKRYFLLPATFRSAHVRRPFFLSIPLRSQSILIFIYVALNIIFLCVHYHLFAENIYWPEEENIQLTRYIADRSGVLAFAQIPLLIAFAGRNSILIWLTGWSFTTFNVWHKWVARVCVLHTFIHSVGYTVYAFQEGGAAMLAYYYEDVYLQYGAVVSLISVIANVQGTVAACLLCFQAMYVFRLFWYEIFLVLHILLAIVFIVGSWYHVNLLEGGHMEWLYASIALWAFDRLVRWIRMALLNISWSKGRKARTAHLQIIGPDAIKAEISVGYNFSYKPGQYIYVYFPRFNFWESHPFTIASYELSKANNSQPTVTLLFRTHGGLTRKLQNYLIDGAKELTCLVEGPYGHYCPVDKYDKVLLLAGGVGITAVFPYLQYLSSLNINRVHFIWIVRDEDSMRWLSEDIAKLVGYENFDIEIHITKSGATGPGVVEVTKEHISNDLGAKPEVGRPESDGQKVESNTTALTRHIHVDSKPCLRDTIAGYAKEHGSLAVLACGPDTFVDETRAAVAENVTVAKGVIDYFEEAFTW